MISKLIANKLKPFLSQIISPFQMAFVEGRTINDNNLVSHEIMHSLHKKKGKKSFMAIKVDLAKDFDRVECSLLIIILSNLGFCDTFTNWILQCISTSLFSFLINGTSHDLFRPTRGIRQ